jgi:hypothetical protein
MYISVITAFITIKLRSRHSTPTAIQLLLATMKATLYQGYTLKLANMLPQISAALANQANH